MQRPIQKTLLVLLLTYGAASLIHFIHNAEFLADYPNLPPSWSRTGVYLVWVAMSIVGVTGWVLIRRGNEQAGLLMVAVYAALGIDSLGHYVLAPLSAHTAAMNATILLEVTTAGLLFIETVRLLALRVPGRSSKTG